MNYEEIKKLVKKAKKKDSQAFGQLFDEYHRPIFGYTLRRVANVQEAQDLTSETFFKALKNLHQFEWRNGGSFSGWLFRIATNEINSYFRKKKNILSLNDENYSLSERIPSSETSLPDFEIIEAQIKLEKKREFLKVHKKLKKLKQEYQTVITLKYFEKKKIKEISQILEKPEGTVKSWIHRGLKELRELLEPAATF